MENAVFWERMYAAYIGRMIGLCHRYVNDLPLAEDLAHEAFLKAMERADTFRATGNFEAWLMRITVNHAIQYLRKRIDIVSFEDDETPDVATEETPVLGMDFTQEELLQAVQQLPVRERTVFNLYAIDKQSHAYIADLLNISIASSKETLYRARKRLRQSLNQMAQKQEKRKKGVFVMILLSFLHHSEAARTDRMFRNGLSSLEYAPAKPFSTAQIRQAAAEVPSSSGVFVATHRAALAIATIAGVVGGVCIWQVARTALANNPLQDPIPTSESSVSILADSIGEKKISVETHEANMALENREVQSNTKIIIVTKEVVVNDTVFIRDTAIVKDTLYLMEKP